MTKISLTYRRTGEFLSCEAQGHSGYAPEGSDIVCAAVSVLLRTTAQVLLEAFGNAVKIDSSCRGVFKFSVKEEISKDSCQLIYAADFLRSGFNSLQAEYPEYISVQFNIRD